ncbi:helicase with zinc finger domain 2 isoform X1 [Electrophorus electricus]|nr:helicase with zinc finger domain 2 isoform X1 [Electrophorus electricus]
MPLAGDNHKLHKLQRTHDVCVRCSQCCRRNSDISYSLQPITHHCLKSILLARPKGSYNQWKQVAERPKYSNPSKYAVCCYYTEGKGCSRFGHKCSFARSPEEVVVWNFMKAESLDLPQLISLLDNDYTCPAQQDKPLAQCPGAQQEISCSLQGTFVELCKTCFHDSPQKISSRVPGTICASGHVCQPVLVFCHMDKQKKVAYDEVRPLPKNNVQRWKYCKYVEKGEPCWHGRRRCWFAHSEIEMAVWESESRGRLNRSDLLHGSQGLQTGDSRTRSCDTPQKPGQAHYCHLCKCQFHTYEEFMNHCFTVKHRRLIFEETAFTWRYRNPPLTSKIFGLCERMATCEYGDNCMKAHSVEELQEWRDRHKASRRKARAADKQGLLSYQDILLEEYRHSENKDMIMKESLQGVSVSCDTDLNIFIRQEKISHRWTFKIKSKAALDVVALLRQDVGATFALSSDSHEERSYSNGIWFETQDTSTTKKVYEIIVSFTSTCSGLYEQWLVFDFDMRPVLLQKLRVRVGPQLLPEPKRAQDDGASQQRSDTSIQILQPESTKHSEQVPVIWQEGNVEIIPYQWRSGAHHELLKRYKNSKQQLNIVTKEDDSINRQNYKKKMHSFLYQEEMAEGQLVSRLNLRGKMTFKKILFNPLFGLKNAISGELFGSVSISHSLAPNTPEGYILKRHVQSVLVGLSKPEGGLQRAYEALILKDTTGDTELHLQLSNRCCTELKLETDKTVEMEVQFQLDRIWFCEMHKAVDILPDLRRVLPDLSDSNVQVPVKPNPGQLNEKQQAAMDFILGASMRRSSMAPLLIYGPFGTGKTFTLAKITLALAQKPQNKILICTHTNSSADLYIKDHFHSSVSTGNHPARPLRIKAKEIPLKTTDRIILQYCSLSKDGFYFEFPDRDTLDATKIIITTTAVARFFHDMQLPPDYFSHIFIDEASQMLECEALMALGLAGEKTQVVLAGDHMQMGPKLFSVGEDKRSDHTLLNRLFHYYQAENTATSTNSRIIFNENYRSTKEIVDFVSTHFYVGKKNVIKAKGNVFPHPNQYALQFYHARGQCWLDKNTLSWFNATQIETVADIVLKVLNEWPEDWPHQNRQPSICVLSQGSQVYEIRKRLKQYELHDVTVENAENVQGKQFRVIIISTVQTKDSLKLIENTCLEFFNDMRVLNTVMTRAQSQVIVVGDAAALCCSNFGKCWRLWRSYINHCIAKGSVYPEDFTLDCLNQELLEIKIIETEEDDSSDGESIISEIPDIDEDPILKELLDEDNHLQIKLTEEGLFPVLHSDNLDINVMRHPKQSNPPILHSQLMWKNNPGIYRCELVLERYDSGYAKPLDEPTLQIEIKGRKNVGRSFSGAIVMVEMLTSETSPQQGKVIEVLACDASSKEFVCTLDNNDNQVMMPINICIPKLYTPFWKDKPNHIAIRNPEKWTVERFVKINEEARRNNLFVVKFLKWREGFQFPLGIVVKTLPRVTSLQNGLKVLDVEYQLKRPVPLPVQKEMENLEHAARFSSTNACKDFLDLMTFTIDPANSQDLDDAISVRDLGQNYEIGIHIADVASFVAKDSELDRYARKQGTAFYVSEAEPTYMFPKNLATKVFSLLPQCNRHCISLITEIDKQTHHIQKRTFFRSVICSKKKLSYEDAEDILKTSGNEIRFDTLEGCVAVASLFAEVHRKHRKQGDWCYNAPDEDEVIGRRQSHILVEELMIMFNHTVADRLLADKKAMSLTPLRCQDRPDRDKFHQFLYQHISFLPMSIHLSSQLTKCTAEELKNLSAIQETVDTDQEVLDSESFPILTSVLKNLEIAAMDKDIYRIIDLISTDDIHPQLLPVMLKLRRFLYKAHILRANSTHFSRIGHYDLELDSYTWASSPIRRYVDIIVQRLLHSVLDNTEIMYTSSEIDTCCVEFAQKNNNQAACEKKSHALNFASKLSTQNAGKVAYIVEVTPTGNNFRISFPLNRTSIAEKVDIMFKDLQLADQPMFDEENKCMVLKWVRRVYSFSSPSIHAELKQQEANNAITHVPTESWKCLVEAIKEENWAFIVPKIEQLNSTVHPRQSVRRNIKDSVTPPRIEPSKVNEEHFVEMSLKLKQGEIIEVQLGTDTERGLLVPAVQLLIVNPKFEICMEHSKNPVMCFSKYALYPSRTSYNTYRDYQKIWKPLCEMESAASAVAENESIVIVDATLKWKPSKEGLHGSFNLPLEKKAQWAIEGNLRNCFLCIRSRIQQKNFNSVLEDHLTNGQDLDLMDVPDLIWIAHGVVTKVSGEEESKELTYMEIDFRINHMPMLNVPESILCSTARFTVELIPKLLPDVRKESAIDNLTTANHLVKSIATGKKTCNQRTQIQTRTPTRFEIEGHLNLGFPYLNNSQCKAIKEALNNEFTLIQGPPGTGKTVVGVHIVYWFFQQNQKLSHPRKARKEDLKKMCILYCGPSNKSVDVVAGQLLKLQRKLKPLRVYSDQMEIQEFPYPGSNLRLSRHSQRVEKPNKELRSITLHHRIRMSSNPFSGQIKEFDLRIQKAESLTDEEIKRYKDWLKKARKHELMEHDVILCTCTAASHPSLVDALSFQQIIIDECAMATEPEAFIPLATHKPEQIVLLGDHKQLQPVVHCEMFQRLGMGKSLFERYMQKALMLDTQYRMQEDICAFPSQVFYEGKLKTGIPYKSSVFLNSSNKPTSIIFGHIEGKEISLVVSTERGNENSKANIEEAKEAVRIALRLIKAGIPAKEIAILTPYNAQVAKIKEILWPNQAVTVNTIMKSQGSEWRYVILSTVRSCPKMDTEVEPTKAWFKKKLGFVVDPHQVNVAITRAQEGLCIIGNKDLLWSNYLWKRLLKHYQDKNCLVDPAKDIQVSLA